MKQNQNGSEGSLRDLWLGIIISIMFYLIGGTILAFIIGPSSPILILIAHIATIIICFKKGKKRLGQGLLIGMGLVILLTAACFGLLFTAFGG